MAKPLTTEQRDTVFQLEHFFRGSPWNSPRSIALQATFGDNRAYNDGPMHPMLKWCIEMELVKAIPEEGYKDFQLSYVVLPRAIEVADAIRASESSADKPKYFCDPTVPDDVRQMVKYLNPPHNLSQRKAAEKSAGEVGSWSSIDRRFRRLRDKTGLIREL